MLLMGELIVKIRYLFELETHGPWCLAVALTAVFNPNQIWYFNIFNKRPMCLSAQLLPNGNQYLKQNLPNLAQYKQWKSYLN